MKALTQIRTVLEITPKASIRRGPLEAEFARSGSKESPRSQIEAWAAQNNLSVEFTHRLVTFRKAPAGAPPE